MSTAVAFPNATASSVITQQPEPRAAGAPERCDYNSLLEVMHRRATARSFDPTQAMADETYRLILDAARLAPSGANVQPWHFIVVTSAWTKHLITNALERTQAQRAATGQKMALMDYSGIESAAGCIVVVSDFRLTWAYPGLMDGTELDQRYHATAERIILQSVASATTAAHLAAAALGYQSWWLSLLGQDEVQAEMHQQLGVPADLTITDLMLFGTAAQPVRPRWKKQVDEVASWDKFDMANFRSMAQIDAWMADIRAKRAIGLLPTA